MTKEQERELKAVGVREFAKFLLPYIMDRHNGHTIESLTEKFIETL